MSDVTTTRICSECGLAYRESPLPHQCAEWTRGTQLKSRFDQVFEQLEAPDYPATCDQCGLEGTNVTIDSHVCNEPPVPRAGERVLPDIIPELNWKIINTPQGPSYQFPNGRRDWPTPRERQIIAAFHKQHATLVEQRERLVKLLTRALSPTMCYCNVMDGIQCWQCEVREVLITIEQEGEASR